MKVIFLDMDGVLNYWGSGTEDVPTEDRILSSYIGLSYAYISKTKANLFSEYIRQHPDIKICVSSTWRVYYPTVKKMITDFKSMGLPGDNIVGRTDDLRTYNNRHLEIAAWINSHDVEAFVILDDIEDFGVLQDHLVWTDPTVGLTEEDLVKVSKILGL